MNLGKRAARLAGILIIAGMVAGILSIVPSVEGSDFLTEVYPNRHQVLTGALFQFLLVPIYIGFSLVLYPILRKYQENLAVGFVGFRIISGVFQIVGTIVLPVFVYLSHEYLTATPSGMLYLESLGELLKLVRDLTNHLGVMVATGLGNLLLYSILYRGKYLPRWLSIWGVVGNVLIMGASFLIMAQAVEVVSAEYVILTVPLVVQELVLAIWLITKGLDLSHSHQAS